MAGHCGLSPPTRGSPRQIVIALDGQRSIPAHAGEPRSGRAVTATARVYPRPRGGATMTETKVVPKPGLSPPTRGSPRQASTRLRPSRSIPAHAGEPCGRSRTFMMTRVYPRPRGGAMLTGIRISCRRWVYPRPRGGAWWWQPGRAPSVLQGVYPRPRGGAALNSGGCRGLSPPTRGSPDHLRRRVIHEGSIPAHAGEPRRLAGYQVGSTVYPRPRGGASCHGMPT